MKENNEITLRIKGSLENFERELEEKGYEKSRHFILDDVYMIPKDLNIEKMSTREIISKAIIIRKVDDITKQEISSDLLYKIKKFNEKGEILEQKSIRLKVLDCAEAENFMQAIGYRKIMNIIEEDYEYKKDNFSFITKNVKNGDKMIEVETEANNSSMDTIDKLKKFLESENLPLDYSDLFVKKAEVELDKILGRVI